ncbi:MAG: hypothetical protein EBV30_10595 [Actinobacteria bacterium]|nr:hypothetical protein [Actinomycetota bacterium]
MTGADILPKNFVPVFVDLSVTIRRDITNLTTPDNAALATLITNLIHKTTAGQGLKASDIIKILEDAGVDSVKTPFTMRGKLLNTDGSTTIYSSEDILILPQATLARLTDNYVTPRIAHFYPGTVTVSEG